MSTTILAEPLWRFAAGHVSADAWTVAAVHVRDALSDLYRATLVLAMEPGGEALEGLVGGRARLETQRGDLVHPFQGIVRGVEDLGTTASHRFASVEVVPSLWLLSQRSDVRLFQERNVVDVIRAVLRDAGLYQGSGALRVDPSLEAMTPREYLVQYGETDLDFVRRLLEDEGIPFRFEHAGEGGEALVLAGDEHVWPEVATREGAPARVLDEGSGTATTETVGWFDERHEVRTTSVTVRDYDFTRPRASLDMTGRHGPSSGPLRRYEYPARASVARYDAATGTYGAHNTARLARVRTEEHQCRAHVGRGRSNLTGMVAGTAVTLTGHERPDLDGRYLITEVVHSGSAWHVFPESLRGSARLRAMLDDAGVPVQGPGEVQRYENRFRTHRTQRTESSVPFRPARVTPRPVVEGPQTARVVGPAGEDIHTDSHGRIKVQFHWDRVGGEDENSSCWIRLAQTWGGGAWGFTFVPRIGMEVIVDFLEGDPDRPLVTGCVYNGENQHATALPDTKTQSAFRTKSTPETGGYNEIRLEDRAGEERFYVQAERDHDTLVKHDQTVTVQRHRTKLVQGEEYNTIEQNRVTHVQMDNTRRVDGNQDVEVHGGYGATLAVDNNRDVRVGVDQSVSVGKNSSVKVGENHDEKVGENQSVSVGASQSVSVGGAHSLKVTLASAETVGLAKALTVGAAYQITVGGMMNTTVIGFQAEQVGLTKTVKVGTAYETTVGGMMNTLVTGAQTEEVGLTKTVKVAEKIELVCGEARMVLDKSGKITLEGTEFSFKSSGPAVLEGDTVLLQGKSDTTVTSTGGDVLIKGGPMVKINT